MSDDLKGFMFNSLSEDPKKKVNNAMALIAEALSRPDVVANEVYDPNYEAVKKQQAMQPDNYTVPTRSFDDIAHPERAGLAARQRKLEKSRQYAEDIANLPTAEIANLCDLMKNEGRRIIEAKVLKKLAEETGETIETENLEKLELVKRDVIQDESGWLIEFKVTNEGRRVHGMLRQYFANKLKG
jgi:hypothetical protein